MPETYCGQCGIIVKPTDLFCRRCGASLISLPASITTNGRTEPNQALPDSPLSVRTACLITAGLISFSLALVVVLLIFLVKQPGGKSFVAFEIIGTPTAYPTQRPYRTALPYPTSTEYPLPIPYPTTGELVKISPDTGSLKRPFAPVIPFSNSRGCEIRIKNQYPGLDAVILMEDVDEKLVTISVFVRSNDTFTKAGIPTGTYYVYVALGQDWDNLTSRFNINPFYFRFKEQNIFNTCSSGYNGGYQYLEITLNASEGAGSGVINVQPENFPIISP